MASKCRTIPYDLKRFQLTCSALDWSSLCAQVVSMVDAMNGLSLTDDSQLFRAICLTLRDKIMNDGNGMGMMGQTLCKWDSAQNEK